MLNMDCQDAKWLVTAVKQDGRGFEDEEERLEYQQACDHARNCRCDVCTETIAVLDGQYTSVSIGQA